MPCVVSVMKLRSGAYSDDVDGRFQREVNGHSGHVNKLQEFCDRLVEIGEGEESVVAQYGDEPAS